MLAPLGRLSSQASLVLEFGFALWMRRVLVSAVGLICGHLHYLFEYQMVKLYNNVLVRSAADLIPYGADYL
jgi:hypothetical protein